LTRNANLAVRPDNIVIMGDVPIHVGNSVKALNHSPAGRLPRGRAEHRHRPRSPDGADSAGHAHVQGLDGRGHGDLVRSGVVGAIRGEFMHTCGAIAAALPADDGGPLHRIAGAAKARLDADRKATYAAFRRICCAALYDNAVASSTETCLVLQQLCGEIESADADAAVWEVPRAMEEEAARVSAHDAFLDMFRRDMPERVSDGVITMEEYIRHLRSFSTAHFMKCVLPRVSG